MTIYDEHGAERPYLPLSDEARKKVLIEWNATKVDHPQDVSFIRLFEQQVGRTPDALAVVCDHRRLTYRQLNQQANRLAHHLKALKVGEDLLVSVLEKRRSTFLIAILAVFKAGGAYLPLDPYHTPTRLRQILTRSESRFVLVSDDFSAKIKGIVADQPVHLRPRIISIEQCLQESHSEENLSEEVALRSLAYVIYTSGSTGVPKGVMIEQRGMLNHLYAKRRALQVTENDWIAQTASQCFDISVWQFLTALMVGGCTHIFSDEITHDPVQLLTRIDQTGISIFETVPSLLRVMLDALEQNQIARPQLSRLRWLIPTGEALPPELCRRWLALYPNIPLLNAYGPTECSDDVTHYPIYQPPEFSSVYTPIGMPIENMRMYVLDQRMEPVPIGVNGELFVGGVGVGRGYRGEAQQTAEAFVPDPFGSGSGDRLYKTGDLVRYLADGALEFLGRIDHQIKIRGYRIELGEIEAILHEHDMVKDAIVVAQEYRAGDKRLVAYIVPMEKRSSETLTKEVRSFLKVKLPDYMIPATIITFDSMPLTPNGKVDRKALPAPNLPLSSRKTSAGETSTGAQKRELLDRLLKKKGLQVSTQPAIRPVPRTAENTFPVSFAQQRLWVLEQLFPGSPVYNVPGAFLLKGTLDIASINYALNEIIRRHEVLRTTFSLSDEHHDPIQIIASERILLLPLIDLTHLPEEHRKAAAMLHIANDARAVFDLHSGPLLRATLLRMSQVEHLLLFTMHHIISDGWSLGILLRELTALYNASVEHRLPTLETLPIQYADYALWQRRDLQGEFLERQLSYWRQQLTDLPSLSLPTDHPRPAIQRFQGATYTFRVSAELTQKIQLLGQQEQCTLFMTLLASFQVLLWRYSGQDDIPVGTTTAGRSQRELESLIGFFVNTLVLRCDLSGNPSFRTLLQRVRRVTLDAFAHQDVPVEMILEAIQPTRDSSQLLILPVAFALQTLEQAAIYLTGLQVQAIAPHTQTAKLDLSLLMWPHGQELAGAIEYNIDLFEERTIARMAAQFQELLLHIVAYPEHPLSHLPPFPWQVRQREHHRQRDQLLIELHARSNLTQGQLVFWLGQQFQPEVPLYHSCGASTFYVPMDYSAYQQALQMIVNSSDALRTVIVERDGVPFQHVKDQMTAPVGYRDFAAEPDPRGAYRAWVRQHYQKPFRLDERLFEMVLVKLAEEEYVAVWNVHHTITDTWSAAIVQRWLSIGYQQALTGQIPQRVDLPSYQEAVEQERANMGTARGQRVLAYWEQKLAHRLPQLSFDGQLLTKQGTRMQRRTLSISSEQVQRLKGAARNLSRGGGKTEDTLLFTLLVSVLGLLLYRYSGNRRIAIAIPVHNRRGQRSKETIGLFMAALPIQIEIHPHETLSNLIQQIGHEVLQTMRHGQYAVSNPVEPELRHYDVVFNYQTAEFPPFADRPTSVEVIDGDFSNESLVVSVSDFVREGRLAIELAFHEDVFGADWQRDQVISELQRLLEVVQLEAIQQSLISQLLASIAATPDPTASRVSSFAPFEPTVLKDWERHVNYSADRVALVSEQSQWTYEALERQSIQVAWQLQEQDVGIGWRVGLLAYDQVALLIGSLSILRVGGTIVLLPSTDHDVQGRLEVWLQKTQAQILLTTEKEHEMPVNGTAVISFEVRSSGDNEPQKALRFVPTSIQQEAVFLFSASAEGSVLSLSHASLKQALVNWHLAFAHGQDTDILQETILFSAYEDARVLNQLTILCAGMKLIVAQEAVNVNKILSVLEREQVTLWQFTGSIVTALLQSKLLKEDITLSSVHTLIAHPELVRQIQKDFMPAQIRMISLLILPAWDEMAQHCLWIYKEQEHSVLERIGLPLLPLTLDCEYLVLDGEGNPPPVGVPGRLHVGGRGLAEGSPDRAYTAQHWVLYPRGERPGDRLYCTEVCARLLPDGTLEWLGEMQESMQGEGYRITHRSVEAIVMLQPDIQNVAVMYQQGRLVAYLVGRAEKARLAAKEMQRILRERMPESTLPQEFFWVESLPLTPRGTVDTHVLAATQYQTAQEEYTFVAPRNPIEEVLAAIWAELLEIESVGVYDDFFEIGGHSLLLVRLVSQIEKQLGQRIPVATVFQGRTIAALASFLRQEVDFGLNQKVDLQTEAILDAAIFPENGMLPSNTEPAAILLTGGTGFLGRFLLHDLLTQTQATIYCLVRAGNNEGGKQRLIDALKSAGLWHDTFEKRIVPVVGDLSLPLLGLTEHGFEALARSIETIYHCGAQVNFFYPYQKLKATNVLGTQEVIRLACRGKTKRLHYISTISVLESISATKGLFIREDELLDNHSRTHFRGYAQSKWVAEKLVVLAQARGLPTTIYRPGRITGHSRTGFFASENDLVYRVLKGCVQLGSFPDLPDYEVIEMAPVDYVSKAVVSLSRRKDVREQVFHLFRYTHLKSQDLVDWMNDFGYLVRLVPYNEWLDHLVQTTERSTENALSPLLPILPGRKDDTAVEHAARAVFDNQMTLSLLAESSIVFPQFDNVLLHTYFSYFIQHGLLEGPAVRNQDATLSSKEE